VTLSDLECQVGAIIHMSFIHSFIAICRAHCAKNVESEEV